MKKTHREPDKHGEQRLPVEQKTTQPSHTIKRRKRWTWLAPFLVVILANVILIGFVFEKSQVDILRNTDQGLGLADLPATSYSLTPDEAYLEQQQNRSKLAYFGAGQQEPDQSGQFLDDEEEAIIDPTEPQSTWQAGIDPTGRHRLSSRRPSNNRFTRRRDPSMSISCIEPAR